MRIKRVRTLAGPRNVLDLSDYEFDSGIAGICERIFIAFKNAGIRFLQFAHFVSTSFLGSHYVYIITWALVSSWILYPEHNMSYTDASFQAVSAVTSTGLNTVNINELKLYQQLFIFIVPVFVHPLTVSSFMVFYRSYMYKRRFDDIEVTSKNQSKSRRAATISQYESQNPRGSSSTRPPEINLQLMDRHHTPEKPVSPHDSSYNLPSKRHSFKPGIEEKPVSQSDSSDPHEQHQDSHGPFKDTQSKESHSSSSNGGTSSSESPEEIHDDTAKNTQENEEEEPNKIRFGALPRPPSRDRHDHYNPSEMYRSSNMMRNQVPDDGMDEDDGPALVIKSPRDIEADERRGIHSAVANPSTARRDSSNNVNNSNNNNDSFDYSNGSNYDGTNHRRFSAYSDQGLRPQRTLTRSDTMMSQASNRNPREMRANYLSWTPTVGHNSAFIGSTKEQKEELGGVEYRALKMSRWITVAYFLAFLCLGWSFLIPWVYKQQGYAEQIRSNGVSPVLFAMTTTLSAFNNNGYAALPSSMGIFWHSAYVPVILSFIIMGGNVAIPIFMRYAVWIVFKISPKFGQTRETLGFLSDHPRRCFMLSFPAVTTLWSLLTLVVFMIVEVALFMILNSGTHSPQPDMSAGPRLLSAYFQSIVVRTVGFTMIDVGSQHPGMSVLNTVMMYIAIYPVAMSIRKSNVYEEQTIGRYYRAPTSHGSTSSGSIRSSVSSNAIDSDSDDDEHHNHQHGEHTDHDDSSHDNSNSDSRDSFSDPDGSHSRGRRAFIRKLSNLSSMSRPKPKRRSSSNRSNRSRRNSYNDEDDEHQPFQHYTGDEATDDDEDDDKPSTLIDHMRRQLSMDIWSLVSGLMLIAIIEGGQISRGEFTLFEVIYEVVSAHGTVGSSTGFGDTSLALSGGFSNLGKLVMMAIMIRGRHRAMPYNVDRAVILKGSDIIRRDREQENRVRDARQYVYREPSQSGENWLPRVGTAASRSASFGTLRRRPSQADNQSRDDV